MRAAALTHLMDMFRFIFDTSAVDPMHDKQDCVSSVPHIIKKLKSRLLSRKPLGVKLKYFSGITSSIRSITDFLKIGRVFTEKK
jgi:hypothetical protein